jgi:hypothetical protein
VLADTGSSFHIGFPLVIDSYVPLNMSGSTLDFTTYKN